MRIALFLLVAFTAGSAIAQDRVASIIPRLTNPEMRVRHAAFDELIRSVPRGELFYTFVTYHRQADQLKVALIGLLQADDDAFVGTGVRTGRSYTEDDSEHWASIMQAVAGLADERSIPALVDASTSGSMASAGVLQFGAKALPVVLSKLKIHPKVLVKSTAFHLAIKLLSDQADVPSRDQALNLIREGLGSPEFLLRLAALERTEMLADDSRYLPSLRSFRQTITQIAENDPLELTSEPKFPVRRRARGVLEKLR